MAKLPGTVTHKSAEEIRPRASALVTDTPVSQPNPGLTDNPAMSSYVPKTPTSNSWWKPLTYKQSGSNEVLASSANALIPSLSETEGLSVGRWLGSNFQDFADYSSVATPATVMGDTSSERRKYFSKERAQSALADLDAVRTSMGASEENMGAGYAFLKKTVALLDKYAGTEGGISRANFKAMQDEFETLSDGVDSSYVSLGKTFVNPTTQGGNPLMETSINNGTTSFGLANSKLFT